MTANPFPKPSDEDFALARRETGWTPRRTAVLKWTWGEGLSCSQIAARLTGLTRNAVIGKLHRIKVVSKDGRPKASAPRAVAAPVSLKLKAPRETRGFGIPAKSARKPIGIAGNGATFEAAPVTPMPKLRCVEATGEPARIIDPGFGGCKWPIDDPGRGRMEETRFCCGPRDVGKPYCPSHLALAWNGKPKPPKAASVPGVGSSRGPGGDRYAFGGGVQ